MTDLQGTPDICKHILEHCPEHLRAEIEEGLGRGETDRAAEEAHYKNEQRIAQISSRRRQQQADCGLSGKQWGNMFTTFRGQTVSQRHALTHAEKFVDRWPEVKCGAAYWGAPGIGKDHLLHGIVQAVLDKEAIYKVRYWYALDFERALFSDWHDGHSQEDTRTEEQARGCDLLLIGDIHHLVAPTTTAWVKRVAVGIINQCETTGKPILCCTSNYPLSEFDERNLAVGSRLAACCNWKQVAGEDHRRTL